jgi:CBS domain containing-hemolysin-like protein
MTLWILLTLAAILVQALFALFEMACVSFNKVRLQYYVSLGKRRALWIHFLLKKPSRLFGTTLIGINTALQIGSETSRRFYESIHIDPDFAPITQVLLVVLLGELVPMTIARRHPERMAIFLTPFMVALARLLSPITWAFDQFSRLIHKMISKPVETPLFLSREEVIMTFEERPFSQDEFNAIVNGVFHLKNLTASQLIQPLASVPLFPTTATVGQVRSQLPPTAGSFLLVYHRSKANIVSIVYLRDLFSLSGNQKIAIQEKSPWFVTKETSILQILDQFRRNNQSVAIILAPSGEACGILTLDQIVDAIFGPEIESKTVEETHFIDRTLEGSMLVAEFNRQFNGNLPDSPDRTLGDLVLSSMDHPPSRGETVRIGRYEITILEPSLRGARLLNICTFQE